MTTIQTTWRVLFALLLVGMVAACTTAMIVRQTDQPAAPFRNPYVIPEDTGDRVTGTYFFRRAWTQITRDLDATDVPPTVPLDIAALADQEFAVSWLGHASMLVRAQGLWILIDPVLSATAGPVQGFGPARLAPLPIAPEALPHIDAVLISHDHYDHLDHTTVRRLARQAGGAPRFFVGKGLAAWFEVQVGVQADEFEWWQARAIGDITFTFVPAQHNSGRSPWHRNDTLWGGWVIANDGYRFYFPGDTAYVAELFRDIRRRIGPVHLAALPIGAYRPRALMRHEHLDPDDAVQAHTDVEAARSFGVHWGTFQLGDDEPFDAATDLAAAVRERGARGFGLAPIGSTIGVHGAAAAGGNLPMPPEDLRPVKAGPALTQGRSL
jgi:L-ascorbate metabolism protein UlaG (beta-lactamase superfamily)